jgi:subtilisin family serine protease
MKRRLWLVGVLVALLWATPAMADNRIIVRTTLGLQGLQQICLANNCTVVATALDGTLGQVFVLTTTLDPTVLLPILKALPGIVDAEVDQLLSLVGGLNVVTTAPTGLTDTSPVNYFGATVWNGYANQPAASVVNLPAAQSSLTSTGRHPGSGIVADIDTGVDPNHPALAGVLLPGYDFTRNLAGGSEMTDLNPTDFSTYPPPSCPTCTPAKVNQSSVAVLDQSSVAVLDGNSKYAAFGHGTMVMGVIHLVAPTAQLLPLKAFHSDGTGFLSDILRAIYYGVQNNANAINMSFDFKSPSPEMAQALDYANKLGVICAASAGNDGQGPPNLVYPAALQSDVMGVASVGSITLTMDTRSSFSNYGNGIVWVAAPGEAIVTTYPFSTYSAGWGTSFSAPFVSGTAALLRALNSSINESVAATAVAHAAPLNTSLGLGNGRLDVNAALQSLPTSGGTPDFSASAAPSSETITAGQQASFTVSAVPSGAFHQMVTWSCTGAPAAATCAVSPSSVTLDGSNPATATVTFTTTARGMVTPLVLPRQGPPMAPWWALAALFAWLAVLMASCNWGRASRWRPGLVAAAGVLAVSLCTYACGGYGNGNPPPGSATLSSVGLNPATVTGGSSSTGTVTLSGPASGYGATVNLSSSASAAMVPASVTVAAGATSANFTATTSAVTASTPVTITAAYGGVMKTASLTVNPPAGTPAGTYTLTITGTSGNLSHSTMVQVTVN